jgi:di/tricarboxylate transporter
VAEWCEGDLVTQSDGVFEVVLSPRSSLLGKSLFDVKFRERYGFAVLAIWRGAEQVVSNYSRTPLQFGDALLVQGPYERRGVLGTDPDFIVLGGEERPPTLAPKRRWAAIILCAATLVWAAFDHDRAAEVLLLGALAMVICKVMTMDEVYRSIEWRTVFMVAGMLPMGMAVTKTGLGTEVGTFLAGQLGDFGPMAIIVGFMLITMALTQMMSGPAVAAIMAPIAIQTASAAGVNPRALVMAVTMATSMAFITPLGHPVNVLVLGPAGYRFRDFARVGVPMAVLVSTVVALMIPLLFALK